MVAKNDVIVPDEILAHKIYEIRGEKVMVDRDLAMLYGVETKYLKRQVKRNIERFPADFMFELTREELDHWRRQFGTSNSGDKMGLRYLPIAFTEQGIAMLSSVLKSPKAIQMNIQIMRIFTRMRKLILQNEDLLKFIQMVEQKTDGNTKSIELFFEYMDQLTDQKEKQKPRKSIGFKRKKK